MIAKMEKIFLKMCLILLHKNQMGEVTCSSTTLHRTVSCYGGNGHKIGTIRGQRKAIGMLVDLW